jgi:hypothetical protein
MDGAWVKLPIAGGSEMPDIVFDKNHLIIERLDLGELRFDAHGSALEIIKMTQLKSLTLQQNLHETFNEIFLQTFYSEEKMSSGLRESW